MKGDLLQAFYLIATMISGNAFIIDQGLTADDCREAKVSYIARMDGAAYECVPEDGE